MKDPKLDSSQENFLKQSNSTEAFWTELIEARVYGDMYDSNFPVARMNGTHYILYPREASSRQGMTMLLEFISGPHAGKRMYCDNIWCQGEIPKEHRSELPDNVSPIQGKYWEMSQEELEELSFYNFFNKTTIITADFSQVEFRVLSRLNEHIEESDYEDLNSLVTKSDAFSFKHFTLDEMEAPQMSEELVDTLKQASKPINYKPTMLTQSSSDLIFPGDEVEYNLGDGTIGRGIVCTISGSRVTLESGFTTYLSKIISVKNKSK